MITTTPVIPSFLDVELLSRLPGLELQAKYLVEGFLSGLHRSTFRGHNVEFMEFRGYQPGDEPRTIDWKVYARSDRLYVKLREEETNLTSYVVVDVSASMNYASPRAAMTKWQYARSMAAALLLLLNRQQDAASLVLAGKGLPVFIRPSLRASELRRMMGALQRDALEPVTSLGECLNDLSRLVRRRSMLIVISDFYVDPKSMEAAIGQLHFLKCEPIFLHVMDPRELELDFDSPVLLRELESQGRLPISPDLLRQKYLGRLAEHRKALESLATGHGGDYVLLRTDQPPVAGLGAYLARREGML